MNQTVKESLEKKLTNIIFARNRKLGENACQILDSAIHAVDPYQCVINSIMQQDEKLVIKDHSIDLDKIGRIYAIGFGKSAVPMMKGLIDVLDRKLIKAIVVSKDKTFLEDDGYKDRLTVHLGGHPVPTSESIAATKAVLQFLPELKTDDLVFVLISGGGSALFTQPVEGVSLADMQKLTQILLRCGADINEINTLRKHLDQVKGGRLALRLQPAKVETLILSDVIGDPLDMIASGPTVFDPTTYAKALSIIAKYDIKKVIPTSILNFLVNGAKGLEPETPKEGNIGLEKVKNNLIGTNIQALDSGRKCAESLGYNSLIVSSHLIGKTGAVAEFLDGVIKTEINYNEPAKRPWCLLFGGETTVQVKGQGLGGRNQDLVLQMVKRIKNLRNLLFVSFATDGDDGPTDAAGAVCDGFVYEEAYQILQMNIEDYIADNDSYHFHEKTGGLIKTGSTGTNVNDIILIIAGESAEQL